MAFITAIGNALGSVSYDSSLRHRLAETASTYEQQYIPRLNPLTGFHTDIRVDAEYAPPFEVIQEQAAAQLAKALTPYLHVDKQHGPSFEDQYGRHINYRFSLSAEVGSKPVDNYLAEIDKLINETTTLKQKLAKYENETKLPRL